MYVQCIECVTIIHRNYAEYVSCCVCGFFVFIFGFGFGFVCLFVFFVFVFCFVLFCFLFCFVLFCFFVQSTDLVIYYTVVPKLKQKLEVYLNAFMIKCSLIYVISTITFGKILWLTLKDTIYIRE